MHGDDDTLRLFADAVPATEEDWATEYMSLDVSVKVVDSLDEAIDHIRRYSTGHTESIITNDLGNSERLLAEIDSAVVMRRRVDRFADAASSGRGRGRISNSEASRARTHGPQRATSTSGLCAVPARFARDLKKS